ncbi:MAG: hypothetical protein KY439_00105 [Actinobacteria bacterium]|nr:hypothetical protein [Actinomycetota bacterium]
MSHLKLVRTGLALAAVVVGGCTTTTTTGAGTSDDLPPAPTIIEAVEQDHGYVLSRSEVPAGRVVFQRVNRSGLAHDLSLVEMPEDMPPIGEQLKGATRRVVSGLATLPSHPPGSRDAFAVDLTPGRYGLICWERDGTSVPHAHMGMAVELRVRPLGDEQGRRRGARG